MNGMPEFSRIVRAHEIGAAPRTEHLTAKPAEREALARRFNLIDLARLEAELTVHRDAAGIRVRGRIGGEGHQSCVVSSEPVPARVDEAVDLLFTDVASAEPDEEIELSERDCDVLPLEGDILDLGEAVAQSFGLALDPYPQADAATLAEARRHLTSEEEAAAREAEVKTARNPFAVLKGGRES